MLPLLALLAAPHFDLAAYEKPRLIREADSVLGPGAEDDRDRDQSPERGRAP